MRTSNAMAMAVVLGLSWPQVLPAQEALGSVDRVRVTGTQGAVIEGRLVHSSPDSLWIVGEGRAPRAVPLSAVTRIERSLGRHRAFGESFVIGAGATALAGGIVGALVYSPCRSTDFLGCLMHPDSRTESFTLGLVLGGLAGIPVGLVVASNRTVERWTTVELEGRSGGRLSVRPLVGPRPGLALTFHPGGR